MAKWLAAAAFVLAPSVATADCPAGRLAGDWVIAEVTPGGGLGATYCGLGIAPDGSITWSSCNDMPWPAGCFGIGGSFSTPVGSLISGEVNDGTFGFRVSAVASSCDETGVVTTVTGLVTPMSVMPRVVTRATGVTWPVGFAGMRVDDEEARRLYETCIHDRPYDLPAGFPGLAGEHTASPGKPSTSP